MLVLQVLWEQQDAISRLNPALVLIRAHSRGAVAAPRVAKALRDFTAAKGIPVTLELVLFDPVPGPFHYGEDTSIELQGLSEFTLVYSVATGYPYGFTPQRVFGAQRIIVSAQDHTAGLTAGFRFNREVYNGSRLNSLPAGVYIDTNKTGENINELTPVASMDEFRGKIGAVRGASTAQVG
ncbi:MAG: hypothetical protein ACRDJU_00425, partial [Actinomycetota bacterium]